MIHEDPEVVLYAQHTPLLNVPPTVPQDYHGPVTRPWAGGWAKLPTHPRFIYYDDDPRTGHFAATTDYLRIARGMVNKCQRLAERGEEYRPEYHRLPGGKDGYFIHERERRPEYRDFDWDIARWEAEGEKGPVYPRALVPAAERTEWNTHAVFACAERRAQAGRPTDLDTPYEAHTTGFHNRAAPPRHDCITPPYPSFWERAHFLFAREKLDEKLTSEMYAKPRVCGPRKYTHTIPALVAALTVAEDYNGKMRFCIDFGSPRTRHADGRIGWQPTYAKQPGPMSVNANQPPGCHLQFEFMQPEMLLRRVAILMRIDACLEGRALASSLRIVCISSDQAAWYEQHGSHAACDWTKQIVFYALGVLLDERVAFGDAIAAFYTYLETVQGIEEIRFREISARRDFLEAGHVPSDIRPTLYRWIDARTYTGEEPAFIEPGGFFDDTQFMLFRFFFPVAQDIIFSVWREWNFDVADGTRGRKQKTAIGFYPVCPPILGFLPNMREERGGIPISKLDELDTIVDSLEIASSSPPGRAPNCHKQMERFHGKACHMARAKITMRGDMQISYEHTAIFNNMHPHLAARQAQRRITPEHIRRMRHVAYRARHDEGASFFPRTGILGKNGRGVLTIFSDASADVDELRWEHFRGWGMWAWVPQTHLILLTQQFLTPNARHTLNDSTAFEMHAATESIRTLEPLLTGRPQDVHQIVDSAPTRDVHTNGRAKAPAERELYAQRCELLDTLRLKRPDMAIHTSQVKRHRNEEADLLTKHVVLAPTTEGHPPETKALAELHHLFARRFGQPMQLIRIDPPTDARARLIPVLRRYEECARRLVRAYKRLLAKRRHATSTLFIQKRAHTMRHNHADNDPSDTRIMSTVTLRIGQ